LSRDLDGPINSAIFFKHLEDRKLSEDFYVGVKLGQGAYGKVRLVTHKKTDMIRAAKYIQKQAICSNTEDQENLFQEVEILMNLDHPNIIRVYNLYEDEKNFIIVSEFCSGGELFEKIQKNATFSEKTVASYMKQILSAVTYLHEKGIVHRDLKAENILFENQEEDANIKLIDFGVSTKYKSG
jgi:calcium-dependent protein kinase